MMLKDFICHSIQWHFFNPLNSMRDVHMWMCVSLSTSAQETYYELFLQEEMILSISDPTHCPQLFYIWVGLEIIYSTHAGILDVLALCGGLYRWCEVMIMAAMSCPDESISHHLPRRSFIIGYMVQNWKRPLIPFLLKNLHCAFQHCGG